MADVSQIKLPNGSVYDLIDEKSGYITAEYIENKTDYEIPVSRVGEIVVGETAIGTDSTNFPTSKAVVDYVDERVVQEMDAIDVGVTGIKANGTSLSVVDGVVNIPAIGPNQSVGLMTDQWMQQIWNRLNSIPTFTSQLTNDSGFITSYTETDPTVPAWAKASTKPTYTASEVGALPSNTVIPQIFEVDYNSSTNTANKTYAEIQQAKNRGDLVLLNDSNSNRYYLTTTDVGYLFTNIQNLTSNNPTEGYNAKIKQLRVSSSDTWNTYDYKLPRKTSDLTNDSGYLTASDIASVMTYKGTKANYAALPASGNTTGDVWHLTDTGAEWAWDGSAWQELGTAIDLSGYVPISVTDDSDFPSTTFIRRNSVDNITLQANKLTVQAYKESKVAINSDTISISSSGDIIFQHYNDGQAEYNELMRVSNVNTIIHHLVTPTADNDAANKKYVDDSIATIPAWAKASTKPTYTAAEVGALPDSTVIPSKTSDLTNDSGFITSYTDEKLKTNLVSDTKTYYPIFGNASSIAENKQYSDSFNFQQSSNSASLTLGKQDDKSGTVQLWHGNYITYLKGNNNSTKNHFVYLPAQAGTIALTSEVPTKVSDLTNDSGFISSYTETDPVFSASAAAGITSTDISNWNAKVSDDKTWNGVTLNKAYMNNKSSTIVPIFESGAAYYYIATATPSGGKVVLYDNNAYLNSTTPSANDNSTKVATTAYVDNAVGGVTVPTKTSDLTNDSGFITSYTDEKVKQTPLNGANAYHGLLLSYGVGSSENTNIVYTTDKFQWNDSGNAPVLVIYNSDKTKNASIEYDTLWLADSSNSNSYKGRLYTDTLSGTRTYYLPDKSGTIALTSDIPKVYSSTNTGGYLTMATLPIYDGTVV